DKKHPVIIYLHQYAYSTGYSKGYDKSRGSATNHLLFGKLLDQGYAIVAFDQFGFGTRVEEAEGFYQRIPAWSKMGRMVDDVRGVLDRLDQVPYLDLDKTFILGDALGGTVGMYVAALDDRVSALASLSGFSPYRSSNARYESIRSMSHLHALIPRLGLFAESPQHAPVDMEEIMACIAPRPLMVVAPSLDRHGDGTAIGQSVDKAKQIYTLYGEEDRLRLYRPRDINRMSPETLNEILTFFAKFK